MDKVVCYFSASGTTRLVANKIKECLNCDAFEIEPVTIYTNEDLDWTNKNSRSSVEMNDRSFRPPIKNKLMNIDNYHTIILGFPVWWYTAPTIINTFLEENNLEGKDIYVFVTSGSSSVDGSFNDLKNTYPNLKFIKGSRFQKEVTDDEIKSLLD